MVFCRRDSKVLVPILIPKSSIPPIARVFNFLDDGQACCLPLNSPSYEMCLDCKHLTKE